MDEFKGQCRLVQDKLIIKGKAFTVEPFNNLNQLPKILHPRTTAERSNDDVLVFFTQSSPFSNFHSAPFTRNNTRFFCTEQYIQASKAELFSDDEIHSRIMEASNPYDIKKLGNQVRNFDKHQWEQNAQKIALDCCMAKFTQNERLLDDLLKTGHKTLGEASKDSIWGIAKTLDDPDVLDKSTWTGKNLLGDVLMTIRDELRN